MRITGVQTSIQSPWQIGVAERWVGSCRRDLLDYIIALNERHLKRILADYVRYYHDDRTHLGLRKQTPAAEFVQQLGAMFFLTHDSVACTIDTIARHENYAEEDHAIHRCPEHVRAIRGKGIESRFSRSHSSHIPT